MKYITLKNLIFLLLCILLAGWLIVLAGCSNQQKEALVEKDIDLVSFSMQNQLNKTDNATLWINDSGVVPYDVYWGWKCSKDGDDKSFLWLAQKDFTPSDTTTEINVSSAYCK
tara:strand:+ start:1077 stop:1415 length:339 start_codon:yes stop_codon:yes gene_type:complete